jgi:hypothetical protein
MVTGDAAHHCGRYTALPDRTHREGFGAAVVDGNATSQPLDRKQRRGCAGEPPAPQIRSHTTNSPRLSRWNDSAIIPACERSQAFWSP